MCLRKACSAKDLIVAILTLALCIHWQVDNKSDMTQDEHEVNLGSLLQSMDTVIRERGHSFTGSEENFTQYLELVIKMRRGDGIPATEHRNKLMRDKEKFVQILNARTGEK